MNRAAIPYANSKACIAPRGSARGDRRWADAAQLLERALASAESAGLRHELCGHALYWRSGCLENQGFYFEAIAGYQKTARNTPGLAPECDFREIVCLNHIGRYEEALGVCRSLGAEPPAGFDPRRFEEIRDAVEGERALLERCLAEA
jgi:tetratricopeptide (TPR) repeat protein